MANKNPIRDDNNPQEFYKGENVSSVARNERHNRVRLPTGTVVDILMEGRHLVRASSTAIGRINIIPV
jgi:hypothetical protein